MAPGLRAAIAGLAWLLASVASAVPLQLLIELTPDGGTLRPPPGVYHGPLNIRRAIVLDGGGETVLDGCGEGTVLRVSGAGAVVRGLRIVHSGRSHDQVDAGVSIEADRVTVEDCRLEDVLFGVHLAGADDAVVRRCSVSSIEADRTLRGESIRLWNCRRCRIEGNALADARDVVLANSPDNVFAGNRVEDSRIGVELVFSPRCEIAGNVFQGNEHGVIGVYSDSLRIRGNTVQHQDRLRGSAFAVKGSSSILFQDNVVLDCAVGLTANAPIFAENVVVLQGNVFAYNDVAIYLYGDRGGHVFHDNAFFGNFQTVAVSHPDAAVQNDWSGNQWGDYVGFDRDGDGFGDTPFAIHLFSERLWMERDMVRFFRGSPVLSLIDFVERLAPFSTPPLVLEDPAPRTGDDGG